MITDNMRKENKIIVEALTKMREGAQGQVVAAFRAAANGNEVAALESEIIKIDALIAQHTPKQPTKAVVDKIEASLRKLQWPEWKFTQSDQAFILKVLNEEYPE